MTDEEAIRAAVLDYVEGWFGGDAVRMERALLPELVKRCPGIEGDDPDPLETLTQREIQPRPKAWRRPAPENRN